jgi:hypothetical protein
MPACDAVFVVRWCVQTGHRVSTVQGARACDTATPPPKHLGSTSTTPTATSWSSSQYCWWKLPKPHGGTPPLALPLLLLLAPPPPLTAAAAAAPPTPPAAAAAAAAAAIAPAGGVGGGTATRGVSTRKLLYLLGVSSEASSWCWLACGRAQANRQTDRQTHTHARTRQQPVQTTAMRAPQAGHGRAHAGAARAHVALHSRNHAPGLPTPPQVTTHTPHTWYLHQSSNSSRMNWLGTMVTRRVWRTPGGG